MQTIDLEKLREAEELQYQQTAARLQETGLKLPFGYDPAKLQPIRANWGVLVRVYRGKVKPIRSLRFIQSVNVIEEELWHHVSISYHKMLPGYNELKWTRDNMFNPEDTVLQVFPRAANHVNIHPYCLHLWCNMERQPIPDLDVFKGVI